MRELHHAFTCQRNGRLARSFWPMHGPVVRFSSLRVRRTLHQTAPFALLHEVRMGPGRMCRYPTVTPQRRVAILMPASTGSSFAELGRFPASRSASRESATISRSFSRLQSSSSIRRAKEDRQMRLDASAGTALIHAYHGTKCHLPSVKRRRV